MRGATLSRLGRNRVPFWPARVVVAEHRWGLPERVGAGLLCLFRRVENIGGHPAPDGGYANGNTAEGTNALHGLTTGNTTGPSTRLHRAL